MLNKFKPGKYYLVRYVDDVNKVELIKVVKRTNHTVWFENPLKKGCRIYANLDYEYANPHDDDNEIVKASSEIKTGESNA